jgi:ribonuclease HII
MNAAVSLRRELKLKRKNIKFIAGVDEVGIGPLAGPVVAAAVIMKDGTRIKGMDDSKKLPRDKRHAIYNEILSSALSIGVGIVDNPTIDRVNILQASLKAMEAAVNGLSKRPDFILVDGPRKIPGIKIEQEAVKHGDRLSYTIAAASVVAKVVRDKLMNDYDRVYPHYGFAAHKGYGTELHMKMLKKFGPSPIHRVSYQPVFEALVSKGLIFA